MTAALVVVAVLSLASALVAAGVALNVVRRNRPAATASSKPSNAGVVHDPELAADLTRRTFPSQTPPPIPAGVVEVHKGRRVKPRTHKPPT